jgi:hypothetical protein
LLTICCDSFHDKNANNHDIWIRLVPLWSYKLPGLENLPFVQILKFLTFNLKDSFVEHGPVHSAIWWSKFGGQRFMAWIEENMGKDEGKFALTGRAGCCSLLTMFCCQWPVVSLPSNPDLCCTEL